MKTFFYIDGINFYYSAVKGTPLRWIDFRALFTRLFPRSQIACIKYFTAEVDALPGDPQQPLRPQAYWWALRTLPDFEIHLGHFRPRRTRAKVVNPPPNTIEVYKTEEKGSDVNLAAHLLTDGFRNRYECAIVVSGGGTGRICCEECHDPTGASHPLSCNMNTGAELATTAQGTFRVAPAIYSVPNVPTSRPSALRAPFKRLSAHAARM